MNVYVFFYFRVAQKLESLAFEKNIDCVTSICPCLFGAIFMPNNDFNIDKKQNKLILLANIWYNISGGYIKKKS